MVPDKSELKGPNITIEDVAKACGLSRATVSRVINGESNVKPLTIERVRKAISDLGYHPNIHAQALSGGGAHTIGIMMPRIWRSYYSSLLSGIEEIAAQKGYYSLVVTRDYLGSAERIFDEGRVDGFIFRNMDRIEEHEKLFLSLGKKGVPFVLIGRSLNDYPAITIDNVGGARSVANHFAVHGFKKIVFLSGPQDNVDSNDRYFGFRIGFEESGRDPGGIFKVHGDYSTKSGYNAMKGIVSEFKPDAIFAANDRMALGAILYLHKNGIHVPEDIAIAGFDDSYFAKYVTPSLTTVRQPFREMGTAAMKELCSKLEGSPVNPGKIILPTKFIIRASCGCPYSHDESLDVLDSIENNE
ncbi:MAG: LacI family DNA-binding transcriptional regulator [Rectinema sp.]|jgi:DNA-binding LacI/PurR family transcriptional regulator